MDHRGSGHGAEPVGGFHTRMRGPVGETSDNPGSVLDLVPQRRIVWTRPLVAGWQPAQPPGMPITAFIDLEDEGAGARYAVRVLHPDAAIRQRHEEKGFHQSGALEMIVVGFVIMRCGMIALWLRAALHDPLGRATALTYALGIFVAQAYWVGLLMLHPQTPLLAASGFALGMVLEISVPAVAEKRRQASWHQHHIVERYGLLNLIVLGETLLSGAMALGQAGHDHPDPALLRVAASSLVVVFAMWWLYFAREESLRGKHLSHALSWGYGHFLIFASGAAVGAGFAVLVEVMHEHAHISPQVALYAIAIPVATYLLGLWFVRDRRIPAPGLSWVLPCIAVAALLTPLIAGVEVIAALCVGAVILRSRVACGSVSAVAGHG